MLIYKKDWIDNLNIQKKAVNWQHRNFITKDEYVNICTRYASPYHESSFWGRLGMFLFTIVIVLAASGLFLLLAGIDSSNSITILFILFGMGVYALAEFFTHDRNYFRSGIIDALLYSSITYLGLGICILISGNEFDFNLDPIVYLLWLFPIFLLFSIRFADSFLAFASCICLVWLNALLLLKFGTFGQSILPFESMILSIAIYSLSKAKRTKESLRFWKRPLLLIELTALLVFYASGNYYVIRQLTENLLHEKILPAGDIQLSYFFYVFTILVPLLYVWRGLKQKDYLLIRLGLLLVLAGIFSIRYYHSLMPIETAMISGGMVLLVGAWLGIRYLQLVRYGWTFAQTDETHQEAFTAISSVLVAETEKDLQNEPKEQSSVFKSGSSGGAGAGGSF